MTTATVEDGELQGRDEFRRGWGVVLAAALGIGLGLSPVPIYSMGVFAPHLAAEFGWSMGEIMGGLSITTLMVLWAGPMAGMLAVRVGARRVALASTLLFGLTISMLALSTGSLALYYATWALIAICGAGTLPITWTGPVNQMFDARKGLALGLAMTGTGVFGMLCKPYLAWAIGEFGWRAAYLMLGLLPLLIALPAGLLLLKEAGSQEANQPKTPSPDAVAPIKAGLTTREALREWRFWMLAIALVAISFALAGPFFNMEIILRTGGLSEGDILKLTPLIGLSALSGRLIGGWLMDRFWAPAVGFVMLALPALSFWILMSGTLDFHASALAIVLIGFALGVEFDLIAFLVARYFGMRSYSAIYAYLYVSFALGAGVAPVLFGRGYDLHGNYNAILTISIVLLLAGASSFLLLGRYRTFAPAELSTNGAQAPLAEKVR